MVSDNVTLVATDESGACHGFTGYTRGSVHHESGRYVIGAVHTNTTEGF